MPAPQPILQVDAFTDRPFVGNPAAVCVLPAPRDAEWMQLVAREMNLAETAFLVRRDTEYDLRWFTPSIEVDLCGHATLAAAHVLWEEGRVAPAEVIRFQTRSGTLTAWRDDEWIWLDFPLTLPAETAAPTDLRRALGVPLGFVGRTRFDYLVELEDEAAVRRLAPDLGLLATLGSRGVIVTARAAGGEPDFVSRFFAPAAGVPEDPVTGSSHCALAPFWEARLGRAELTGCQVSARGGTVRVRRAGERVHLGGQAVTVLRGELLA